MDLTFEVCKQLIKRTDNEIIVNLSDNYLRFKFTFNEDWNGLTKFILFHHKDGVTRIGLVEDKVVIPSVLLSSDRVIFTLYGVDDKDHETIRITTEKQTLYMLNSGYVDEYTDIIDVITVDTIEQIYIAINAKADKSYVDDGLALKISYSDIIDALTSEETAKPLSAKQGKILKDLVDTKIDNTALSEGLASKSDIGHNHDERYFTESEVKELMRNLEYRLNNRISFTTDKPIVQTGETMDLTAYVLRNGVPSAGETVYFYINENEEEDNEEET